MTSQLEKRVCLTCGRAYFDDPDPRGYLSTCHQCRRSNYRADEQGRIYYDGRED